MQVFSFHVLGLLLFAGVLHCRALARYRFEVKEVSFTRLCSSKNILTVNGQFPGPTIYANKGDTIYVDVHNRAKYNITLHWHGVRLPGYPWSDGPEYITQCPIQPGGNFTQKIILSDEEGTVWWHAHSEWARATVHGAMIIYPKHGTSYPFPKPHEEVPIIFGEWWFQDIQGIYNALIQTGGDANVSDAYTINGQPGDFYPCSKPETYRLTVDPGKTYLLRLVNCNMNDMLFFTVAKHNFTIVGTDASYTKPFSSDYITISPGQTIDALLHTNQNPNHYYMAGRAYTGAADNVSFDNTTTTAILQYKGTYSPSSPPLLPNFLPYNDTNSSVSFTGKLRSLADKDHPIDVPLNLTNKFLFTISMNTISCPNNSCSGPDGTRLLASVNNISFENPSIDILEAYYYHINGVFGTRFPSFPPLKFNFTADSLPTYLLTPKRGTEVKVLNYNSTVELVFQGTSLITAIDHPMHLHGYSFYVVGWGFGNFDEDKDPLSYNLVDPPLQNTIAVPINGWTAIRFKADNPGVWFLHCHFDRHMVWGMNMVFIVKDGEDPKARMQHPPPDMPPC